MQNCRYLMDEREVPRSPDGFEGAQVQRSPLLRLQSSTRIGHETEPAKPQTAETHLKNEVIDQPVHVRLEARRDGIAL